MIRKFLFIAAVFTVATLNFCEARAQVQNSAPGHVDENLPEAQKAPALFAYGFYATYINAVCYGDQMCDNICKAAFSEKLLKRVKKIQRHKLYDPILKANNCTPETISTLKVAFAGDDWYDVSYQWPHEKREITVITIKVVQKGSRFEIIDLKED